METALCSHWRYTHICLRVELLPAAPWTHEGYQRGQDLHLPLSHVQKMTQSRQVSHISVPTLPRLPAGSSSISGVGGRVSSPLALLALRAVGDEWHLDTNQGRGHRSTLHLGLLVRGSDRQHAPLCTAYPTPRGVPVPRLNTPGLTPWEKSNLRRLSTGKGLYRSGRKNLDEICIAIFQRSWERVPNNSSLWSSGAWGTKRLLLFQQSKVIIWQQHYLMHQHHHFCCHAGHGGR